MYTDHPISIVLVNDEHFMPMAAALLKSIQVNHHTQEAITIYFVANGVTNSSKKKLERSVVTDSFKIEWLDIKNAVPSNVKLPIDRSSFPISVYARLFIENYLPANLERVLYLDADMIVRKDISQLWHTNLDGNIMAAVPDQRIPFFENEWSGIKNYRELGFSGDSPYFNAGLFLVDLKKWREAGIGEKTLKAVSDNIEYADYPDQYGANIALHGKWKLLDNTWNHFASEENPDPSIIHFTSRKPMYTSYEYSKVYQEEFFRYLRMTEWKHFKPIGESARYMQKLKIMIDKLKTMFR